MPIKVLMPALSPTMTEGKLSKWVVKEGDTVDSGDVMAEIETDKATMEVEAVDEGVIGKILVAEGTDNVPVNEVIALLLEDGEDESALDDVDTSSETPPKEDKEKTDASDKDSKEEAKKPEKDDEEKSNTSDDTDKSKQSKSMDKSSSSDKGDGDRVFASPLARRIAKQEDLDLSKIDGSGPHGRIIQRDVEEALKSGSAKAGADASDKSEKSEKVGAPAAPVPPAGIDKGMLDLLPDYEEFPNSGMRKTIAKRLTASARDVPHFNISADIEMDALMALRKELNGREGADYKISVNDFVIKAVALALKRHPDCNVAYTDDAILKFDRVDMAMAVAIDGGLITPIIKDAGSKGLATISSESKELAGKAREGKLQPHEYQGGTFSISNLGMFGVKSFNSIINSPQGGILSVGGAEPRPVVKDGALAIANIMSLTLAVDHRCIDGGTAAGLMKELKGILEDPLQLML